MSTHDIMSTYVKHVVDAGEQDEVDYPEYEITIDVSNINVINTGWMIKGSFVDVK